jgi:hypothetical protein
MIDKCALVKEDCGYILINGLILQALNKFCNRKGKMILMRKE